MRQGATYLLVLAALVAPAGSHARAVPMGQIGTIEDPSGAITLNLVDDDMLADAADSETWRLPDDRWSGDDDGDAMRLKVKLRPNRAMGRMSLSF